MKLFLIYLVAINLISVVVCTLDKMRAKSGGRRVSEKNLMLLSLLGGSVAMYATMRIIRHKTRHNKFMIGIPVIFFLQTLLLVYFYFKTV